MIVPPGRSRPSRSAASTRRRATRSLIDPPGLNDSSFATIGVAIPAPIRLSRTTGVSPTVSRIESLMSACSEAVGPATGSDLTTPAAGAAPCHAHREPYRLLGFADVRRRRRSDDDVALLLGDDAEAQQTVHDPVHVLHELAVVPPGGVSTDELVD